MPLKTTVRLFYFPQIDRGELWGERPWRLGLWVDAGDGRKGWMLLANAHGYETADEARNALKKYCLWRED